ncbi:MAG: methionyl-tRNA formyltransferase [Candidatus Hepatoplasma vulgare]|nr:MAG: methionyl-tRNA formyltransferase [Candidatus Hepatoplasma sp.]
MNTEKIKIVFLGNPDISVETLKSLLEEEKIEITLIITNIEKKIGRNKVVSNSELAKFSNFKKLKILKTENINNDYIYLKENFEFDYLLTCAFGQFLSENILSLPKKAALNIHASLLPKGRGGAPIHWAVINGEKETGYSLMRMIKEMDAGEYFIQHKVKISKNETYDSLKAKIIKSIKENIVSDLLKFDQGKLKGIEQDKNKISFWKNIKQEDEKIDFNLEAENISNKIMGLNSIPGAYGLINDLNIKLWTSSFEKNNKKYKNNKFGEILKIDKNGILIKAKNGLILINEITIPGKKRNQLENIINGKLPFKVGDIFN